MNYMKDNVFSGEQLLKSTTDTHVWSSGLPTSSAFLNPRCELSHDDNAVRVIDKYKEYGTLLFNSDVHCPERKGSRLWSGI